MNHIDEQIENVEISLKMAKDIVARRDKLLRLYANQDFEQLISEDYFTNEASRLVLLMSDTEMQTPEKQASINNSMMGIGGLRQYFQTILQQGQMAERAIVADEQTHAELLKEAIE